MKKKTTYKVGDGSGIGPSDGEVGGDERSCHVLLKVNILQASRISQLNLGRQRNTYLLSFVLKLKILFSIEIFLTLLIHCIKIHD